MITLITVLLCLVFGGGGVCLVPFVPPIESDGCTAEMVDFFPDARLHSLPLHESPDVTTPIVGYVPKYDVVRVIERNEDSAWYRVESADGVSGWTLAGYLRGEETCSDVPAVP